MATQRPAADDSITISRLRFEHYSDGPGLGMPQPRISWIIKTPIVGWQQAAYELEAYDTRGRLSASTGRVESDASVLVPWPFAPLTSRQRLGVRVRVWGVDGRISEWSDRQDVEAELFQAGDWSARFISPDRDEDSTRAQPCPFLRRPFTVRAAVDMARLYITALGVYEVQLNGHVVGDHVLAPGWTNYHHRLRYQTFDVTDLVHEGDNAIGAILGDGWYRGRLGFHGGRRNIYGDRVGLLAQLEIRYTDGTIDRIVTDESWRATVGPILSSSLYDGETYDANQEIPGWSTPGYDDHAWAGVRIVDHTLETLVAPDGPPVRRTQLVAPAAIMTSPTGRKIVDFGQNLVGRVRFTVQGSQGQTITLRHAEVLQDGDLCLRPLRQALATDCYILRGGGRETWEPRFTFHGFRYVDVEGWSGELHPDDLCAVVCHSDLERTGWFECSDPLINRLHENVIWSMRGNFLDIPTDCPQRDERLGWTGDIQVFAPTACFLYDSAGFLSSWLADVATEQDEDGNVPFIVPNILGAPASAAAWGDAAVIVPWVLYQRYGDAGILKSQFASMKAWVDNIAQRAGDHYLWDRGFQFGDWLDPSAPPDRPGAGRTDPHLVASAYFARSAELLGLSAGILGFDDEETHYTDLAMRIRQAFAREYISPAGRLVSDSTTSYALALQFGLLPEPEQRQHAGARLAVLVRESGYRVSTGFVGTPVICDALCSVGAYDAAYRLLLQQKCPSWLYPVTMGATTIWERWDSLLPDGTVNPGEMTSFNHYALGAIADWLHRTVAGLAPVAPGYRHLYIEPRLGGDLTYASARHMTPYGLAAATWRIENGHVNVDVIIPPNTKATVVLPDSQHEPIEVGAGTYHWTCSIPQARRPVLSLDSSISSIVDDLQAWTAIVKAVPMLDGREVGMPGGGDMSLRQLLVIMPNARELQANIEAALESLNREVITANQC